jgi:adenylate cyclase
MAASTSRPETSDRAGGFGSDTLGLLYELLPALAGIVEIHAVRLLTVNILDTYVGQNAGARILSGDIRRGSGATIRAILWYCDMRGFTPLADRMAREDLIGLLNGYFEIMGGAVQDRGGKILKFIGDGMLAIFPIDGDAAAGALAALALAAAQQALAALTEFSAERCAWGQAKVEAGIALHVGDVMYGNIGAPSRLDFTVIGPAVNLVSRIEGLCKVIGRTLLASDDFARLVPGRLASLGRRPVRGLDAPVEVFGAPIG